MSFFSDLFDRHWVPEPNSGCWLWMGAHNENGYGTITRGGKSIKAHRFSYEAKKGQIPKGLEIDHLCRNKCCVNPDHLEAVTHGENRKRVPRQHAYTCASCGVEVLRKHRKHTGVVECKVCIHRKAVRKYDQKRRW